MRHHEPRDDRRHAEGQCERGTAGKWPGEHRRDGDAVQDAEVDEAFGEDRVAADRRRECAQRDDRDAPREACRRNVELARENQAHADQQQERRHDGRARTEPERVVLEVGANDAEEAQIEREVVGDHRDDRDAAQRVDALDATRRGPCAGRGFRCGRRRHGSSDGSRERASAARGRRDLLIAAGCGRRRSRRCRRRPVCRASRARRDPPRWPSAPGRGVRQGALRRGPATSRRRSGSCRRGPSAVPPTHPGALRASAVTVPRSVVGCPSAASRAPRQSRRSCAALDGTRDREILGSHFDHASRLEPRQREPRRNRCRGHGELEPLHVVPCRRRG